MKHALGVAGLPISNQHVLEDSRALLAFAIDSGIDIFDTADAYDSGGSEKLIGSIQSTIKVITKTGMYFSNYPRPLSQILQNSRIQQKLRLLRYKQIDFDMRIKPRNLPRNVQASVRRLRREIDIYLLHGAPPKHYYDEFVAEMLRLKSNGLVKSIGISLDQYMDGLDYSWCDYIQTPITEVCRFEVSTKFIARGIFAAENTGGINSLKGMPNVEYALVKSQNRAHILQNQLAIKSL